MPGALLPPVATVASKCRNKLHLDYLKLSADPCWGGTSEIPKGCLFVFSEALLLPFSCQEALIGFKVGYTAPPTSPPTVPIVQTAPHRISASLTALRPSPSPPSPSLLPKPLFQCLLRPHYLHGLHSILRPYLEALNACPNLSATASTPAPVLLRPHVKLTTRTAPTCPRPQRMLRAPAPPASPIFDVLDSMDSTCISTLCLSSLHSVFVTRYLLYLTCT